MQLKRKIILTIILNAFTVLLYAQVMPGNQPVIFPDSVMPGKETDLTRKISIPGNSFFNSNLLSTLPAKNIRHFPVLNEWRQKWLLAKKRFHEPFFTSTGLKVDYENRIYQQNDTPLTYYDKMFVEGGLTVLKIPFKMEFSKMNYQSTFNHSLKNLNVAFSKDQFVDNLKQRLKDKLNPEEILKKYDDQVALLKKTTELSLGREIESIGEKYSGLLKKMPESVKEGKLDADVLNLLAKKANPDLARITREKAELLRLLDSKKQAGLDFDSITYKKLEEEVLEYRGELAIVEKITEYRQKWKNNSIVKKLKEAKLAQLKEYENIIASPASIKQYAEQYLDLSGIEKFLLYVNKLDVGQNPVSLSDLSLNNHLSKGLNFEMTNKNRFFSFLSGKQRNNNSINNYSFNDYLNTYNNRVNGVRFGLGDLKNSYTHISFFTYQNQPFGYDELNSNNYSLPGTNYVATVSSRMEFGRNRFLEAELSRSVMQYRNTDSVGNSAISNSKGVMGSLVGGEDFENNIALRLKYQDELPKAGLKYDIKIATAGLGYNNPGNLFLTSGQKEAGLGLQKSLLKRKLQVRARGTYREYSFNKELNKKWQSVNFSFEGKWLLKKGQSVAIRYQPVITNRNDNGNRFRANKMERLSVQGNFSKIIRGYYYRNTLDISYLDNSYNTINGFKTSNMSILVNSFQSLALNNNLLYWNTSLQRSETSSVYVFLNSAFTTEIGITYLLLKDISCSSGIGYNSVDDWYSQAGIRQSVSGTIRKKIEVSLFLDKRFNLKIYNPLYYDLFQANISVRYKIK